MLPIYYAIFTIGCITCAMGVFGIIYAGFKYRNWEKEAEYEREQYFWQRRKYPSKRNRMYKGKLKLNEYE